MGVPKQFELLATRPTGLGEKQKKEESKEIKLYKLFVQRYSKYILWAATDNVGRSDIEKIKNKIDEKIREAKSYAEQNSIKLEIIVNEECFKSNKIPSKYKVKDISDNYNIALAGLIIYLVIVKFTKAVKKYIKYVQETGLTLEFNGTLTYMNSSGQRQEAGGLFYPTEEKISFGVFDKISGWYGRNEDVCGTFEHEFGHYLDSIKSLYAKRDAKLKEHYKKLVDSIEDEQIKPLVVDITKQINSIATSVNDKAKAEWFIALLNENIQKFNDNLIAKKSSNSTMRQAALVKMYNWITSETSTKPTQGASKYVETYLKDSLDPEDLSTATNRRYWGENFADARRKSKLPIFQEIKSKLGNNLKSEADWESLCKLADSTTADKNKIELAKDFKQKLTKGRRVWGLAYRILQIDKSSLIDILRDTPVARHVEETAFLFLADILNEILNQLKTLKDIDQIVTDEGETSDDKLKENLDSILTILDE